MNMEYGLAGTLVAVEYQAVTVFIDAFISSDDKGNQIHPGSTGHHIFYNNVAYS